MYWSLVGWMNSMSLRVCGILHVMCKPFLLSYSLNGGTCVDGVRSYTCNCLAGFTGDRCDKGQGWFCLVHLKQNKRTMPCSISTCLLFMVRSLQDKQVDMIFIMHMLFYPQTSMNVQQVMPSVRQDIGVWTHWVATNVFVSQVSQAHSVPQVSKQVHAYCISLTFYESEIVSF